MRVGETTGFIAHKLVKPTGINFALGAYVYYGHRNCPHFITIMQQIMLLPVITGQAGKGFISLYFVSCGV